VAWPSRHAEVLAAVCGPAAERRPAGTAVPRRLVAICLLAALMAGAALLGYLGLPPLLGQAQGLLVDLRGAVAEFVQAMIGTHSVQLLGSTLDAQRLADLIVGGLQQEMTGPQVLKLIGWSVAGFFGFMLVWVLIAYFLLDTHAIAARALWLLPP